MFLEDVSTKRIESISKELGSSIARIEGMQKQKKIYNAILGNFSSTARRRYLKGPYCVFNPWGAQSKNKQ